MIIHDCKLQKKESGAYPNYTDLFKATELRNAEFSHPYNFPLFTKTEVIPPKLVPFDKIFQSGEENHDAFVHFFLPDFCFERFWRNPKKYITQLKKFAGCIMPDYSLCYDFPYPLQLYNCYRNRVLGFILSSNDIPVIMNISFADPRSYDFCCNGINKGGVIATGSLGTMKNPENRTYFYNGLSHVLATLAPSDLIIYGTISNEISDLCKNFKTKIHLFTPKWDASFVTKEEIYG